VLILTFRVSAMSPVRLQEHHQFGANAHARYL
jgi:hypothetical protein